MQVKLCSPVSTCHKGGTSLRNTVFGFLCDLLLWGLKTQKTQMLMISPWLLMPFHVPHADHPQAYQSSLRQSKELQWGQHDSNLISCTKTTSNLPCSLWPELWKINKQRKLHREGQHLSLKIEPRRFLPTRASSSKLCSFFCHSSLAQLVGERVLLVKARASAQWPRGTHQEVRHQNQCSLRHKKQQEVLSCQYMLWEPRPPEFNSWVFSFVFAPEHLRF